MRERKYKSANKTILADAYGYKKGKSIVQRILRNVDRLSKEQKIQLGEITGGMLLLPSQIEIIVVLLGKPEKPALLYDETIVQD